jgi:hypothetical protein
MNESPDVSDRDRAIGRSRISKAAGFAASFFQPVNQVHTSLPRIDDRRMGVNMVHFRAPNAATSSQTPLGVDHCIARGKQH